MRVSKLNEFFKGWLVGNFEPSLFKTNDFEVAVKSYKKGDYEITIITKGTVVMNLEVYNEGDIIVIEPGDATDFRATNDVTTTVIKFPCVEGDKYLA